MKMEMLLSAGVGVYYVVVGAIYIVSGGEAAGVALLLLSATVGALIALWSWDWRRRRRHVPRPEDVAQADTPDAAGVVGVYPTASLRPLAVAVGMCAIALGVVLGSWMVFGGAAIVASQVALLVRDADR